MSNITKEQFESQVSYLKEWSHSLDCPKCGAINGLKSKYHDGVYFPNELIGTEVQHLLVRCQICGYFESRKTKDFYEKYGKFLQTHEEN